MRTLAAAALLVAIGAIAAGQQLPPHPQNPPNFNTITAARGEEQARFMAGVDARLKPLDEKQTLDRRRQLNEDCVRAMPARKFCECLKDRAPAASTFSDYVIVVTHSKEELGYGKLDKDMKAYVDQLLSARDVCVARR
jgi:hypothetical protein